MKRLLLLIYTVILSEVKYYSLIYVFRDPEIFSFYLAHRFSDRRKSKVRRDRIHLFFLFSFFVVKNHANTFCFAICSPMTDFKDFPGADSVTEFS